MRCLCAVSYTHLSRTEKTICLAVSPALKYYGIPGRARLFEVVQKVKEANSARRWKAPNRTFTGSSDDSAELNSNPALEIDYIVAPPRMALYLESVSYTHLSCRIWLDSQTDRRNETCFQRLLLIK